MSAISERDLGRALDQTLLRAIQSITLGLALLYSVLATVKPFSMDRPGVSHDAITALVAVEIVMAAMFAAMHLRLRLRSISPRFAHPLAGLIAATLVADSVLHMVMLHKPLESLSFMLIALGVSFFFFSTAWFVGAEIGVVAAFALSAWLAPTPPGDASPWVDLSLAMFQATVLACIVFAVRLRDRRRLEALLWSDARLQEDLARANQELEAFNYSVSHDLRAPVRAVEGFARAILDRHGPTLEPEAVGYVGQIRQAGRRMNELIDDQLELARVARAEMVRVQVDLASLCRGILDELATREAGRSVVTRVQSDMVVHGDPGLLRVAFENLLGNAWKYTSHRPDARIDVECAAWATGCRVTVRDNGVGFDSVHAERLFRPFARLHGADFPGTGVGLAIVERIVRRHGGVIEADGQPGVGATFALTLPVGGHLGPRDMAKG